MNRQSLSAWTVWSSEEEGRDNKCIKDNVGADKSKCERMSDFNDKICTKPAESPATRECFDGRGVHVVANVARLGSIEWEAGA